MVALLDRRDAHHDWARSVLDGVVPPMVTCESVVSEACFLMRSHSRGEDAVIELVERGVIQIAFRLRDEIPDIRKLMMRFASVPMSLADACLVRMTELDARVSVLTLDSDFRIYRRHQRQRVPLTVPIP